MYNESEKTSLFHLSVDEDMKFNFKEIAKWAKFLGVIGFIGLGFIILAGIGMIGTFTAIEPTKGISALLGCLIIVGLYFYPVFTLFKFGKGMKVGIINNDQLQINTALRNLKYCFQYMGIITIILLCIYGLIAIIAIISFAINL